MPVYITERDLISKLTLVEGQDWARWQRAFEEHGRRVERDLALRVQLGFAPKSALMSNRKPVAKYKYNNSVAAFLKAWKLWEQGQIIASKRDKRGEPFDLKHLAASIEGKVDGVLLGYDHHHRYVIVNGAEVVLHDESVLDQKKGMLRHAGVRLLSQVHAEKAQTGERVVLSTEVA